MWLDMYSLPDIVIRNLDTSAFCFFFIMNNNVHADGGPVNTYRRLALQRDGAASITVRGAVFGTS